MSNYKGRAVMEILASISETTLYTITGPLIFEELIPLFFKETLFCFFIVKKKSCIHSYSNNSSKYSFSPQASHSQIYADPLRSFIGYSTSRWAYDKGCPSLFFPLVHLYLFLILLHETISLLILLLRPHNNRSIWTFSPLMMMIKNRSENDE